MVFDPELITILVDGAIITGYSDDSKVSIQRNEDDVTPKTGIKGDTVYSLNGNRSGTVKFSLFPSSTSLVRLRRLAQKRKAVACTVRNANDDGGFIVSNNDCRIVKTPGFDGGKEADAVEISIYVPVLDFAE